MSKSYWMKEQKGNFSNDKKDTFDPSKRYVGVRLQQGVPLLDRDWNELEDIRRHEELMLRRWYVGNGTPDDGFKISAATANDFKISSGRCIVEGFEAVNEAVILYSKQNGITQLISQANRKDVVYLDVWIIEVTKADDPELANPHDVGGETCVRHKLEWRVRVDVGSLGHTREDNHYYYNLAAITWGADGRIKEVEDRRITNLTLASVRNDLNNSTTNATNVINEVKTARGTRNSLGERLDESLTMKGNLKNDAIPEINTARGNRNSLGDRLNESLTPNGNLNNGVVGNDQIKPNALIAENKLNLTYKTHSNAYDPSSDEKAALLGTSGAPSSTNKYVTNLDLSNSNDRTPVIHGISKHSGNIGSESQITFDASGHDHSGGTRGRLINTSSLDDNAVATAKIQNDAVTAEKILNGSVGPDKIADAAISISKLNITLDIDETTGLESGKINVHYVKEGGDSHAFYIVSIYSTVGEVTWEWKAGVTNWGTKRYSRYIYVKASNSTANYKLKVYRIS